MPERMRYSAGGAHLPDSHDVLADQCISGHSLFVPARVWRHGRRPRSKPTLARLPSTGHWRLAARARKNRVRNDRGDLLQFLHAMAAQQRAAGSKYLPVLGAAPEHGNRAAADVEGAGLAYVLP